MSIVYRRGALQETIKFQLLKSAADRKSWT
jgi:hypothetical protein